MYECMHSCTQIKSKKVTPENEKKTPTPKWVISEAQRKRLNKIRELAMKKKVEMKELTLSKTQPKPQPQPEESGEEAIGKKCIYESESSSKEVIVDKTK